MLVALIGHYERTAQHLAGPSGLRCYPAVDGPHLLRVRARSAWSLLQAAATLVRRAVAGPRLLIGIPRSNSRALRLLTALLPRCGVFSYSDGLGDTAHAFYLAGSPRYLGHVGFDQLSPPPLIHTIALQESIEPWLEWIRYDPDGPALFIVKRPKEVTLDASHLLALHRRAIAAVSRRRQVVLSGTLDGLEDGSGPHRQIGPLARLSQPLAISGAIGLPSTAFITLAARLPLQHLHILRTACARAHPEAQRRNTLMKRALERCLPAVLRGPAAATQHLPDA